MDDGTLVKKKSGYNVDAFWNTGIIMYFHFKLMDGGTLEKYKNGRD